jgi:cytochrome b subunit of formate dehydrogenase
MKFSVCRDGVEIGEFEAFDFFEGITSGKILPSDKYWHEGLADWKRVEEMKKELEKPLEGESFLPNRTSYNAGYRMGFRLTIYFAIAVTFLAVYGIYRLLKYLL